MNQRVLNLLWASVLLLNVDNAHAFYNPTTGRWLTRDPVGERGGKHLQGFVNNCPVSWYDVLGRISQVDPWNPPYQLPPKYTPIGMTLAQLESEAKVIDASVRTITCCCYDKTALVLEKLSGTATGPQVTMLAHEKKIGCSESITVVNYYWWDCFTAQKDYDDDPSFSKPRGIQDWQDYGWHLGTNPQTQSVIGNPDPGLHDSDNWDWRAAVIYIYCAREGHLRAKLGFSDQYEWDWDDKTKSWTNMHEDPRTTVQ